MVSKMMVEETSKKRLPLSAFGRSWTYTTYHPISYEGDVQMTFGTL